MPRKVNCGIDLDIDYYEDEYVDDYYDYNNDNESDGDVQVDYYGTEETFKVNGDTKSGLWQCSICTFDNHESLFACEICGVIRDPMANIHINGKNEAAWDVHAHVGWLAVMHVPDMWGFSYEQQGVIACADIAYAFEASSNKLSSDKELGSSSVQLESVEQPTIRESISSFTIGAKSENSVCSLVKENLDLGSGHSKDYLTTGAAALRSQYKPETWILANQEGVLPQLNLAIVGHVDSGKSTLSGRLLSLLGKISPKEMRKYEKEAKSQGKGSFAYAWALDESAEERERGITMTVAVAYFHSKKYHVVLLDSPGHRDFVPNMIFGANQADAAVLVIDASVGSFEAGMDVNGGQTREHAQLIRSFGVDQVIVAINKMDTVEYSKERFDSIKGQLGTFLRGCGFRDSFMMWVPLSAMENQNMVTAASDVRLSSWYQGPFLLDAIDSLQPPMRDISKPLIMPICDVIKSRSTGQLATSGKLETGALRSGLKVLVMPSGDSATVRSLERDSKACDIAKAGDNVVVYLQGLDVNQVMAGGVLCHPDYPVAIATHLELKILVLDVAAPILVGSQVGVT
ncbi:hypothetical protein IFM89_015357 [Coptis chinensis]|uniref:Elongation factor 1-alpha n=1 Tax=Coptis chinensis TaxID=261450 RepID=A0A835M079_9MAGN|nr:hypothetical protein IFM89_015357 [Coptis chinensis]